MDMKKMAEANKYVGMKDKMKMSVKEKIKNKIKDKMKKAKKC